MKSRNRKSGLPRARHQKSGYLARLVELHQRGAIPKGRITHVLVHHSESCGLFAVGVCSCRPDIEIPGATGFPLSHTRGNDSLS